MIDETKIDSSNLSFNLKHIKNKIWNEINYKIENIDLCILYTNKSIIETNLKNII